MMRIGGGLGGSRSPVEALESNAVVTRAAIRNRCLHPRRVLNGRLRGAGGVVTLRGADGGGDWSVSASRLAYRASLVYLETMHSAGACEYLHPL
jgi:hypothetical protein